MGYNEDRILDEARKLQNETHNLRYALERQERENKELIEEQNRQLQDQLASIRWEAEQKEREREEREQEREARAREREFEAWIRNSHETLVTPEIAYQCWIAACNGKWNLVMMALEKAPELFRITGDFTARNGINYTNANLLHLSAASVSDIKVLDFLATKISISTQTDRGSPPLQVAVRSNPHAAVLEYLIKKDIRDEGGLPLAEYTLNEGGRFCDLLLFNAVSTNNSLEVIQCLVAHGANVRARVNETTMLHYVLDEKVAEYLIAQGADVNAEDKDGYTPLERVSSPIRPIIRKHGGRISEKTRLKENRDTAMGFSIIGCSVVLMAGVAYWLYWFFSHKPAETQS